MDDAFHFEDCSLFRDIDANDDEDYNEENSSIFFYVEVDMSEFRSAVDEDENEILGNQGQRATNEFIDEELQLIDTDEYEFSGFHEDERKRMLQDLRSLRVDGL
ncbi:hypothetical protein LXL04_020908 [Taraxacum kok-saghyz]